MEYPAIVFFGATGDLFKRKLLKAQLKLWHEGVKPEAIVCVAKDLLTTLAFQDYLRGCVDTELPHDFLDRINYISADLKRSTDYDPIRHRLEKNNANKSVRFYLAVSPSLYIDVCNGIQAAHLADNESWGLFEKPLGEDLVMAFANHSAAKRVFGKNRSYADHFVEKIGVTRLFAILADDEEVRQHITSLRSVEVVAEEALGTEGRSHFVKLGTWKDMASHLGVLLCGTLGSLAFPDLSPMFGRQQVAELLELLDPEQLELQKHLTWGQYGPGNELPGLGEDGCSDPLCDTAIAVRFKLTVPTIRSRPLEIRLMTGKRLPQKNTLVRLKFADGQSRHELNATIDPISACRWIGFGVDSSKAVTERELYPRITPTDDGYQALLKALLDGKRTGFTFREFQDLKERLITPVSAAKIGVKPITYPAGSAEPLSWQGLG